MAVTERDIEVSSASEVPDKVKEFGFALWRGMISEDLAKAAVQAVAPHINKPEAYIKSLRGILKPTLLGEMKEALFAPEIAQTFELMLGPFEISERASPLVIAAKELQSQRWHQDITFTTTYAVTTWMGLTHAGARAPGMQIALHQPGKAVAGFSDTQAEDTPDMLAELEKWPLVSPVTAPGDVLFFDTYSIHRTYVQPGMDRFRLAYKLTALAKSEANVCAQTIGKQL